MESNTESLKRLSSTEKPNNQTKLANVGGTPLSPSQIKHNILKGKNEVQICVEIVKVINLHFIIILK